MKKNLIILMVTSVVTSIATVFAIQNYLKPNPPFIYSDDQPPFVATSNTGATSRSYIDFSEAAETAIPAVVQISTLVEGRQVVARDPFNPFGGSGRVYRMPNHVGSGSGVIVSKDGYIVTNYHVIQNAKQVQVTFNNRDVQIAQVVGTDPAMDIALLKIEGNNYPFLNFGNSDDLKLGQWVLAVGFPLNLETTVTAGIVSAKARSIGINQRNAHNAIESFIQTDAAVNPGNSGGALIDASGNLIGINTAIASPTGAYAGYSYAIPSNIVVKAVQDLKNHGKVQRAYLGVELVDLDKVNPNQVEQLGLSLEEFRNSKGVFIHQVVPNGASSRAGLVKGDFITAINGRKVWSSPQLMEAIAQLSPGNKVNIEFVRKNKTNHTTLVLQGEEELIAAVQNNRTSTQNSSPSLKSVRSYSFKDMGIKIKEISPNDASTLQLPGGVQVTDLEEGIIKNNTNIKPGFIIFNLNNEDVASTKDFEKALNKKEQALEIAGRYPHQSGIYYYKIQLP